MFVDSCKLAALLTEGELAVTSNSSVVGAVLSDYGKLGLETNFSCL